MRKICLFSLLTLAITVTAYLRPMPDQQTQPQPSVTIQPPTLTAEATHTLKPTAVLLETEVSPPKFSGLLAFYSNRDGNPEIYIQHEINGEITRLTNDPSSDDSPAVSPDGSQKPTFFCTP
ncbi:MAG: hypothetical protein CVU41_01920 [Chloroflexi bacterium HGW-Chloroflexi-3]|nr:MAG: hypothetical protein CVU41_01920 [Chloroflexi bacterium HGW-Chloroflexi-3]